MVSTYDPNLRITEQGDNDNPNTWGDILNQQVITLLCDAIAGVASIDFSAGSTVNIATTTVNGGYDTARNAVLELVGGPLPSPVQLIVPAVEKVYIIRAAQTGGFPINIIPTGGASSIALNSGSTYIIYTNGTNIYEASQTGVLVALNNLSDLANAATARTNLGLGTAATLDVGTAANNIVQLDGNAKLPAVDGSQLINVNATPAGLGTAAFLNAGTAAGNLVQLNGSGQLPAVDGSLLTGLVVPNPTPNGKIVLGSVTIQWGTFNVPFGVHTNTVSFGTPFSAAAYSVVATESKNAPSTTTNVSSVTSLTASSFSLSTQWSQQPVNWIAIGPT